MKSAMILPCGVSIAPNRAAPGFSSVRSVVTRPFSKMPRVGAADLEDAAIGEKG